MAKVKLSDVPRQEDLFKEHGDEHVQRQTAVLSIDLDGFKAVNDVLGHGAGDCCLEDAASAMQEVIGCRGTLFRGGDEFTVILDGYTAEEAKESAETIRKSIQSIKLARQLRVTASIGVALSGTSSQEKLGDLIKQADDAAYASKVQKNRVTICPIPPELGNKLRQRRAEDTFAAGNRTLLLKTRELTEAFGQLCYHVDTLYATWKDAGDRGRLSVQANILFAIEKRLELIGENSVSGSELREIRNQIHAFGERLIYQCDSEEISVCATGYAHAHMHRTVIKFVQQEQLVEIINALESFCGFTENSSDTLDELLNCCRSLLELSQSYSQGHSGPRIGLAEYMDTITRAWKISSRASKLTADLLPELRRAPAISSHGDELTTEAVPSVLPAE